jgi:hypothetical protein
MDAIPVLANIVDSNGAGCQPKIDGRCGGARTARLMGTVNAITVDIPESMTAWLSAQTPPHRRHVRPVARDAHPPDEPAYRVTVVADGHKTKQNSTLVERRRITGRGGSKVSSVP